MSRLLISSWAIAVTAALLLSSPGAVPWAPGSHPRVLEVGSAYAAGARELQTGATARVAQAPLGPAGAPPPVGSWPTYEFAGNRSGYNYEEQTLSPSNAARLQVEWNVTLPGPIFASPTEVNGTVYVGSWDGNETALDASNGTVIWSTYLETENFSGQSYGCVWASPLGVTSAAALYNGTVYVGGGTSYFALNASTGTIEWTRSTGSAANGYYAWSSPLFFRGNVYVGVSSQCDNPLVPGALLELSGATGKILHTLSTNGGGDGSSVWSSPSVDAANNTVWITTGNGNTGPGSYGQAIVAVNATTLAVQGSWQVPSGPPDIDFGAGGTLFNDSLGHPRILATNKDGYAYAWNRSAVSRGPVWSDQTTTFPGPAYCQPPGQALAPASFDGRSVYLPSSYTTINGTYVNGSVRAADPANGSYRWETPTNGTVQAGLASANGLVVDVSRLLPYSGSPGNCYSFSAANDSWLQVLDASSGRPLYSFFAGYAFAVAPTIADGRIFVGAGTADESGWTSIPNHQGHLYAFGVPLTAEASIVRGTADPQTGIERDVLLANVSGGMPGYACAWMDNGVGLVPGCQIDASFAPGDHALTVDVRDAANTTWSGSIFFHVNLSTPPALPVSLQITPSTIALGGSVQFTTGVNNGTAPFLFSYLSLPPGCVSGGAAQFQCVPTQPGNYSVRVNVSDSAGQNGSAVAGMQVLPGPVLPPPPEIVGFTALPALLESGSRVLFAGSVVGGKAPLNLSLQGLPPGCVSAGSLNLSCVPTGVGQWSVQASAVDSAGRSAVANATVDVRAPLQIVRFSVSPAVGLAGATDFAFVTELSGGVPPISVLYSGLPPGCRSSDNTTLDCTPSTTGTYAVLVSVNDSFGGWDSAGVNISVNAGAGGTHSQPSYFQTDPIWVVAGMLLVAGIVAGTWVGLRRRRGSSP